MQVFGLTVLCWAGFVVLLGWVPWMVPPATGLPNVASVLGYNIDLAYLLTGAWAVAMAGVGWALSKAPPSHSSPVASNPTQPVPLRRRLIELAVLGLAVAALYWPWSLARFGPHVEDVYFLNILWRIQCGQVPFADFEFLYGPLMLAPLSGWVQLFGFSMASYYGYYLVTQFVLLAILLLSFQRALPNPWHRYTALVLLAPFVIDHLLGLNWTALRYIPVLAALVVLAHRPMALARAVAAGAILGVQAAYSYEYGALGLATCLVVLATGFLHEKPAVVSRQFALIIGAWAAVWVGLVWVLLGELTPHYWRMTLHIARSATDQGFGQFAFYWTVQSAALFGLLSVVIVGTGAAIRRWWRHSPAPEDLLIFGALIFALGALKVALQRADFYHMVVPFLFLLILVLRRTGSDILPRSGFGRQWVVGLVVIASLAQAFGHLPLGRWVYFSSLRGALHEVRGTPKVAESHPSMIGIHRERSLAQTQIVEMQARLRDPDLQGRPVIFYGSVWAMGPSVATCPSGYSFYDILYSDDLAPLRETALATTDMLVVIKAQDFADLAVPVAKQAKAVRPDGVHGLAQLISSPHFSQSEIEDGIEFDLWKSKLGDDLLAHFTILDRVGNLLILGQADG